MSQTLQSLKGWMIQVLENVLQNTGHPTLKAVMSTLPGIGWISVSNAFQETEPDSKQQWKGSPMRKRRRVRLSHFKIQKLWPQSMIYVIKMEMHHICIIKYFGKTTLITFITVKYNIIIILLLYFWKWKVESHSVVSTLWPMDYRGPGILQARILGW